MRGAILGLLAAAYHFLTIRLHFPSICLLFVSCAGWKARCEGSHFGCAGGCRPFPYHLLTLSFPFAYCLSHVHDGEQHVREPFWDCWRLPTISLPFAYSFLTICLLFVSCAGRRARSEGSHFGVNITFFSKVLIRELGMKSGLPSAKYYLSSAFQNDSGDV